MSCVYSTLKYVSSEARRHDVTPILTFDQPLWWKAQLIVACEEPNGDLQDIVLRLGGFHTEMSFLGSIGHIMVGSGLLELLELVYAQNAVGHMLSGKAISRAVKGHLLVDSALNALLTAKAFGVSLPDIHTPEAKGQTNTASDHRKAETDSIRPETEFGMDESVETDTDNEQLKTSMLPSSYMTSLQIMTFL